MSFHHCMYFNALCDRIENLRLLSVWLQKGMGGSGEEKMSIPDFVVLHTFPQLSATGGKSI